MMIKPGDIVKKVLIYWSDNSGRDSGEEGFDTNVTFNSGAALCDNEWVSELEGKPYGIYKYDGEKYIQIENHE